MFYLIVDTTRFSYVILDEKALITYAKDHVEEFDNDSTLVENLADALYWLYRSAYLDVSLHYSLRNEHLIRYIDTLKTKTKILKTINDLRLDALRDNNDSVVVQLTVEQIAAL